MGPLLSKIVLVTIGLWTNLVLMGLVKDQKDLVNWYNENKRVLPWRKNRDPYRIWISEVMLQQTTVAAVIPYYEKFMSRFPSVQHLASADISEVNEMWAGLGYYSRARNLHKSAQILAETGFPKTAEEYIKLPGFGPYTSRAVSSLAFGERVGVLDGNVIRVLSRFYGLELNWWENKEKFKLQKLSDALAQTEFNSEINQGLMELGATICTPKKMLCLICPLKKRCVAFQENKVDRLPLPKPKSDFEIWQWTLHPELKNNKILLHPNEATPFLKKMMFPAGKAEKLKTKPKKFHIKHGVTKYNIFIQIEKSKNKISKGSQWISLDEIKKVNPTSLMTKILKHLEKEI
jgi:A/G-specific adenine glycosylase